MADQFESPKERGDNDVERDRYGRYLLPHPETGKKTAWTRSTTFAKSISDTFALSQWSQRMVAKGLTLRPDLLAMAHTLDVKADKDKLNGLCEDAKAAAGNKVAANLGTALHSFSEGVDRGMDLASVPEAHRTDIAAYSAAMSDAGVRIVPEMIERQTVVPAFEVGGTFDRLLDLTYCQHWFAEALADAGYEMAIGGGEVVGDVKSGQDLQYGWNEIAIQLLIYALGVRNSGVWNKVTRQWEPARPVRLDFAIVMHLPVGQGTCTLWALDLTEAMEALELCRAVRRWRKLRNLAVPLKRVEAEYRTCPCGGQDPGGHVDGCPNDTQPATAARELTPLERVQAAGSQGELSAIWRELQPSGAWTKELEAAGLERLKLLTEKAG